MKTFRYLRCLCLHRAAWFRVFTGAEWEEWVCNRCKAQWYRHR
jgi:hypothetical protein